MENFDNFRCNNLENDKELRSLCELLEKYEKTKNIDRYNKNNNSNFTGVKDVDMKILLELNETDLMNICVTNKYLFNICNSEEFWKRKFFHRFGEYLKDFDVLRWKGDNSWKNYYMLVVDILKGDDIGYVSARATEFGRKDILHLIEKIGEKNGIKNVTAEIYSSKHDPTSFAYYYMDQDGYKQGRMEIYKVRPDKTEYLETIKYWKRNEPHGLVITLYDPESSQVLRKPDFETSQGGKIKDQLTYHKGYLLKSEKWYPDGNKEEVAIYDKANMKKGYKQSKESWYPNGNKKEENFYINGLISKATSYYEDGKIKEEILYNKGVPVESIKYTPDGKSRIKKLSFLNDLDMFK